MLILPTPPLPCSAPISPPSPPLPSALLDLGLCPPGPDLAPTSSGTGGSEGSSGSSGSSSNCSHRAPTPLSTWQASEQGGLELVEQLLMVGVAMTPHL